MDNSDEVNSQTDPEVTESNSIPLENKTELNTTDETPQRDPDATQVGQQSQTDQDDDQPATKRSKLAEGEYQKVSKDDMSGYYEDKIEIGHGSHGRVYRCRDKRDGHICAVKVQSDKWKAAREVQHMRMIDAKDPNHPRVVHLTNRQLINWGGQSAFEMEWRDEKNLANYIHSRVSRDPLPTVMIICKQLLEGLAFLHDRVGLIHAGLKPENILVRKVVGSGLECRIADFGNSILSRPTCIYDKTYPQPPQYQPFEVVIDAGFGPPAEVWTLGCVIYDVATGEDLFRHTWELEGILAQMIESLGDIPVKLVWKGRLAGNFFEKKSCQLKRTATLTRVSLLQRLNKILGDSSETRKFASFLADFFHYDQSERPTAAQLLADSKIWEESSGE